MLENQYLAHIIKCNQRLFVSLDFKLVEESNWRIVFLNKCSKLIFQFDLQHSRSLETVYWSPIDDSVEYQISLIIETLFPEVIFSDLKKSIMFDNINTGVTQAYAIIMEKYLYEILESCDFSWTALVEAKIHEMKKMM